MPWGCPEGAKRSCGDHLAESNLGFQANPSLKDWPMVFNMHADMCWVCSILPKCACGNQNGPIGEKRHVFWQPPSSWDNTSKGFPRAKKNQSSIFFSSIDRAWGITNPSLQEKKCQETPLVAESQPPIAVIHGPYPRIISKSRPKDLK